MSNATEYFETSGHFTIIAGNDGRYFISLDPETHKLCERYNNTDHNSDRLTSEAASEWFQHADMTKIEIPSNLAEKLLGR